MIYFIRYVVNLIFLRLLRDFSNCIKNFKKHDKHRLKWRIK